MLSCNALKKFEDQVLVTSLRGSVENDDDTEVLYIQSSTQGGDGGCDAHSNVAAAA